MENSHVNNVPVNKIIVVDRPFTADDVVCCAMARLINPDVVIERISPSTKVDGVENGTNGVWAGDLSACQLDHDTVDVPYNPACGRLYQAWQPMLIGDVPTDVARNLEVIIWSVDEDANDNMSLASVVINSFRPCWDDEFSMSDGFKKAVDFVERSLKGVLHPAKNSMTRVVDHLSMKLFGPVTDEDDYNFGDMSGYMLIMGYANNAMAGDDIAHDIIDTYCQVVHMDLSLDRADMYLKKLLWDHIDDPVVILNRKIPWVKTLMQSKALYVMYPAAWGGWNIQCVPSAPGGDSKLRPLPSEWVTNPDARPAGCTFVHPAGFLAGFETREDAEAAADLLTELVQK